MKENDNFMIIFMQTDYYHTFLIETPEDVGSIHVSSLSDLIILNPKSFEKHHYYKNILPSFINTTVVVFDSTKHVGLICLLYRGESIIVNP